MQLLAQSSTASCEVICTPKALHSTAQGRPELAKGAPWEWTAKEHVTPKVLHKEFNAFGVIHSIGTFTQGAPRRGDPGLWSSTASR
jgi:hypothetical protein